MSLSWTGLQTITLVAEERPVVDREQTRSQYSALVRVCLGMGLTKRTHHRKLMRWLVYCDTQEYLAAKVVAELPMDSFFAGIFTTVLKSFSGLRISWKHVTATFSLLTTAGASLGLALGCWSPDAELGKTGSIPVLVLLMVVGVINPSGVDPTKKPPQLVQLLKQLSPFAYAIEALCLGEYPGMTFDQPKGLFSKVRNLPRMGGLALVQNGDQVIQALGLAQQTYEHAMQHLAVLCGGYLALSWVGLALQNWWPRMQRAVATQRRDERRNGRATDAVATPSVAQQPLQPPMKLKL